MSICSLLYALPMREPPKAFQALLAQRTERPNLPITIYHRDTIDLAYQVCRSRQLWSEDGQGQANFHTDKFGGGSICGDQITMIFEWSGPLELLSQDSQPSPNTLYWGATEADYQRLWSLVLAAGTTEGLRLVGISDVLIAAAGPEREDQLFVLAELTKLLPGNPKITVPHPNARLHSLVPRQGRLHRFIAQHFG